MIAASNGDDVQLTTTFATMENKKNYLLPICGATEEEETKNSLNL
jgi:hypothetical protein